MKILYGVFPRDEKYIAMYKNIELNIDYMGLSDPKDTVAQAMEDIRIDKEERIAYKKKMEKENTPVYVECFEI